MHYNFLDNDIVSISRVLFLAGDRFGFKDIMFFPSRPKLSKRQIYGGLSTGITTYTKFDAKQIF